MLQPKRAAEFKTTSAVGNINAAAWIRFSCSPRLECCSCFKRQRLHFHRTNCHFVCKFEVQKYQLREKCKQALQHQQNGPLYILEGTGWGLLGRRNAAAAAFQVALIPCPSPALLAFLLNNVVWNNLLFYPVCQNPKTAACLTGVLLLILRILK